MYVIVITRTRGLRAINAIHMLWRMKKVSTTLLLYKINVEILECRKFCQFCKKTDINKIIINIGQFNLVVTALHVPCQ